MGCGVFRTGTYEGGFSLESMVLYCTVQYSTVQARHNKLGSLSFPIAGGCERARCLRSAKPATTKRQFSNFDHIDKFILNDDTH